MFSSRADGVHMNEVARALVTLPAHKGNAASAVTKSMKVKVLVRLIPTIICNAFHIWYFIIYQSFYILLARAPDREDDMLSLSSIKHVGKEIVLVQAFAQPNGNSVYFVPLVVCACDSCFALISGTLSIKPDLCSESAMGVWGLGHRFRMRTRVASNNAFLSGTRLTTFFLCLLSRCLIDCCFHSTAHWFDLGRRRIRVLGFERRRSTDQSRCHRIRIGLIIYNVFIQLRWFCSCVCWNGNTSGKRASSTDSRGRFSDESRYHHVRGASTDALPQRHWYVVVPTWPLDTTF
jgi:hypothetical protein